MDTHGLSFEVDENLSRSIAQYLTIISLIQLNLDDRIHNNENLNEGNGVFRQSKNWRMTLKLKATQF